MSENDSRGRVTDTEIQEAIAKGKQYTLLLYKRGSTRGNDEAENEMIQMGHLRHLFGLRTSGLMILNGPLTDDGDIRGIGILATADLDLAHRAIYQDPAVQAGRLVFELHPWFGLPGDMLK